ncbi:hypothetical protein FIV07_02020 [Mycobacterium sp. THAF192]|nr:hypothetical protein FIV07_02020 [Mycobacterium sp. THAF192]
MRVLPQQDHADLGLIDNDDTEDLRPNSRTAPEESGVSAPAGTAPSQTY